MPNLPKSSTNTTNNDTRTQEVLNVSYGLLGLARQGTLHELIIDSIYFFRFDPIWIGRVGPIRQELFGKDEAFQKPSDFQDWLRKSSVHIAELRNNKGKSARSLGLFQLPNYQELSPDTETPFANTSVQRQVVATEQRIDIIDALLVTYAEELVREFGIVSKADAMSHILYKRSLYWPLVDSPGIQRDKSGIPFFQLNIYSASALNAVLGALPKYAVQVNRDAIPDYAVQLLDSSGEKKLRHKPMMEQNRIRAWAIYLLSNKGGGAMSTVRAISAWNSWAGGTAADVAGANTVLVDRAIHQRDINKIRKKIAWHLSRLREINPPEIDFDSLSEENNDYPQDDDK